MYSVWPIRVGWVAGSGWMPIWLTKADQLRSAHAEPGSQSNQPQSARVACGSSVKSVFWIWSLRPGCSKVSWDLWKGTIGLMFIQQVDHYKKLNSYPIPLVRQWVRYGVFVVSLRPDLCPTSKCKVVHYMVLYLTVLNIGSGIGLVPPGTKPIPEPLLTQICGAAIYSITRTQWVNISTIVTIL